VKIYKLSKSRRPLQAKFRIIVVSSSVPHRVCSVQPNLQLTTRESATMDLLNFGDVCEARFWARFVAAAAPLSTGSAPLLLTMQKEESQSAATKYADRSRPIIRQSSREPNDTALPGNGKPVAVPAACPRTSPTADRRADLLLRFGTWTVRCTPTDIPARLSDPGRTCFTACLSSERFSAARQEAKASVLSLGENT